jgi:hypothetical protein
MEMAKEEGPYSSFEGSPISKENSKQYGDMNRRWFIRTLGLGNLVKKLWSTVFVTLLLVHANCIYFSNLEITKLLSRILQIFIRDVYFGWVYCCKQTFTYTIC